MAGRRGQLAQYRPSSRACRYALAKCVLPGQDVLLEFPEFRAGLDADLVDQDQPGALVRLQRLSPPTAAGPARSSAEHENAHLADTRR
jgi:hypothetical protein